MIILIDILTIIIPLLITFGFYELYYLIFIKGYVKRIEDAQNNNQQEKADNMIKLAIKRQPAKMRKLLKSIR